MGPGPAANSKEVRRYLLCTRVWVTDGFCALTALRMWVGLTCQSWSVSPPEQEEPVSFIMFSAGALTHLHTHTCTSRYSKCGFHISKLVADISRFSCKQTRLPALVTQTVTYSMNLHMYTVPTNALLVSTHNCWSLKHFSLLWSKGDEEVDRTKCDIAECNKGLKTNMATYSWTKAV